MKLLPREAGAAAKERFGNLSPRVVGPMQLPATTVRVLSDRSRFWTLVLLTLLWFVVLAAVRPLMLPDEGRYASIAWEMLHSGEWLTPTLDGLPFFHKPPLFYWIAAASMAVFGPSDLAARVAPMLGAWLASIACFLFMRRWWSERAARFALFALLLQPLFALGGQFANLDMLVAGCITATILLLAHAALAFERGQPYRAALAGAYVAAAFGVLAKGLIGFVIPALVIGAWIVLRRRWRTLAALLWWPGALLFACVAAPWFIAMQVRHSDFVEYFFFVQHFRRFAAGGFNNAQPFWFYPAILLVLALPWAPWLRRQFARARYMEAEQGELRVLMVVWAVLVTVFFSLPESKLIGYILPALPPVALLAADAFADPARSMTRAARWGWNGAMIGALVLSSVVVLALTLHPIASSREVAEALRSQHASGEPVFMLESYYFDVPVYSRLKAPVRIVDAWDDPEIERHDNWRKELADAARFAPARAEHVLVTPERFARALCETRVSWVIGEASANTRFQFLEAARPVKSVRGTSLWRVDTTVPRIAKTLGCQAGLEPPNG